MFGEDQFSLNKISRSLTKYAFSEKKLFQRFIIVLAGPLANFIFGIIGFALIYTFIGVSYIPPIINEVQINSPAYHSDLKSGDKILKIDNKKIDSFREIGTIINLYKKTDFNFTTESSYYGFGWSHNLHNPDTPGGIWSEGPMSTLLFKTDKNYGNLKLEIICRPYLTKKTIFQNLIYTSTIL